MNTTDVNLNNNIGVRCQAENTEKVFVWKYPVESRKTGIHISVADPRFPRGGGANSPGGGRQHTIFPNFPKNCMRLKEFGPGGMHPSHPP